MNSAKAIIDILKLQPHPEGGFFKETYRSEEFISATCLPKVFGGNRNYSTCIYFLLRSEDFSAFHKINQDEAWHFYEGSPIRLVMISPEGILSEIMIGRDIIVGEVPQFIVPKNYWFAAKVILPDTFALVGCTVAPGFDFADFTLPKREELINLFPMHQELIIEFTRE